MNPTEFYRVLYSLDEHKMRNFFRGRTENDRRALAPIVHELGSKADISPIYIPIEVIPEFNVIADSVQKGTPQGLEGESPARLAS